MNFLLVAIFLVLLSILCVLIVFVCRLPKANPPVVVPQESKSLEDMANIMREEHDEKKREERDRELSAYARRKHKDAPGQILSSSDQSERLVSSKKKNPDLIPYGLSEAEKRILEEFNS